MSILDRAATVGIATTFIDANGERQQIGEDALAAVIAALPTPITRRMAIGPVVIRYGEGKVFIPVAAGSGARVWKIMSGGKTETEGAINGDGFWCADDLAVGSYDLHLTGDDGLNEETPLLVSPPSSFAGDFGKVWVLAVQLYGVKSKRNWGIGDFTDLAGLIERSVSWGCAGIGLNPLHVLFDDRPHECSPYAPNSRLFLNPLYIDVDALPWSAPLAAEQEAGCEALRAAPLVDYVKVSALKMSALRQAFQRFLKSGSAKQKRAFAAFRGRSDAAVDRFACFEVLREQLSGAWWEWPTEWRTPDDDRLAVFCAGESAEAVSFVAFQQWCADDQLGQCAALAKRLGMKIGLYLDVAVGVQGGGFDAWQEQAAIPRGLSVGAPPDILNTAGQEWGLAGFNASGLEARRFAPFREMLRAAMRHAGAIRLDHVLGLNRLYLVPSGFSPRDGVYVDMPLEALLAVTAQESNVEECVVVGEDLGTVPDGFRDVLAKWGVWSYRVMMFERDYHTGVFFAEDSYAPNAFVTFNTHDLPTFAGWQSHHDIDVKRQLAIDPGETANQRQHAVDCLHRRLRDSGYRDSDFLAVISFLAHTPSRILALSLEDLLGENDQPNIPGTIDEHPNWRRRLPVMLEDIPTSIDLHNLRVALRSRTPT